MGTDNNTLEVVDGKEGVFVALCLNIYVVSRQASVKTPQHPNPGGQVPLRREWRERGVGWWWWNRARK